MKTETLVFFSTYRFDAAGERLWRGKQEIKLRPKTLAVLCKLVQAHSQLVTKAELLETIWPETYVVEAVLKDCIREIREALQDNAKDPHFIETIHRRGYRFIAPIRSQRAAGQRRKKAPSPRESSKGNAVPRFAVHTEALSEEPFVGRESELKRLRQCLARSRQGKSQVVFVTGEAGIGKTRVVESFLGQLSGGDDLHIAHGQCIEHYGAGEAYLPVLDALGRLCRRPDDTDLVKLLKQYAPMWLLLMPALVRTTELNALQRKTLGASRERMLREMTEVIEIFTAERPLILFLEDLHWSDASTLNLLSLLARRSGPAHLLIIGTY